MSPNREEQEAEEPPVTGSTPVRVQYYAQLRADAGQSEETLSTEAGTVAELFEALDARHDFSVSPDVLRVAVNDSFADWDTALESEDLVVFIPPVAGG